VEESTPKQQEKSGQKDAVVVGKTGDKSIKVAIDYTLKHPKYGKYMRRRTILSVHDQANTATVGDVIEIAQCKPYSKTKRWRLVKVVKKVVAK
jgi:small subunit ribosomal protein S17